MPTPSTDPARFREEQAAAWNSVAAAWMKWLPILDEGARELNERLVELAGVRPGDHALDVACGLGEPTLTAAAAAGPEGRVIAVDLSSEMLRFARERVRERARQRSLATVSFDELDAEELALEGEVDAAVSRWGLMLMQRPAAVLKRIRRALRPGGRLAAAVWGAEERSPFLGLPRRVAQRELALPEPDPDAPGPFRLQRPGQLLELFGEAGFRDCREEVVELSPRFRHAREYVEYMTEMSSSLRKTLADQPADAVRRFWSALEREAAAFAAPDGGLAIGGETICVVGRA